MLKKSIDFVHLHVHSDYSLLDGACHIENLCKQAHLMGMKALSLTDHGNLFGAIEFFHKAIKYKLNPLIGCEMYLSYPYKISEKTELQRYNYNHMGLIAKNFEGYQNLVKLVSKSHIEGMYYKPKIDMEMLSQYNNGLIGFTGCLKGVIPQFILKNDIESAEKAMGKFIDIFGRENFFVEIQHHGLELQTKIIPILLQMAKNFKLKVICSNDVHYVKKEDYFFHDSLLCIQTGKKLKDENRLRYKTRELYLKSQYEMEKLFAEIPNAILNTRLAAEMCKLELPFDKNHFPKYVCNEKQKISLSLDKIHRISVLNQLLYSKKNYIFLYQLCIQGLKDRYNINYFDIYTLKKNQSFAEKLIRRMNFELHVIANMGFIDYFLIVWDFINWAHNQKIPVGPGRGSGAGCLIAYLLRITDIDPMRFNLLFERFLNPERISPPDFDIDFCMKKRIHVIQYVREKYGEECVANIITFGTFGAKMVIRDLARVNDIMYTKANEIAKMIPDDIGMTLNQAYNKSVDLQYQIKINPLISKIFKQGKAIEGMVRNKATHAAGMIISNQILTNYIPITIQDNTVTTQYAKDSIEKLGFLKMDFLGLKTLTIIDEAAFNVNLLLKEKNFDIFKISLKDENIFNLLNKGKTLGIFQLESEGMQALCKQFKLRNIDEIVALIALYRPGPMDLIPHYIKGREYPDSIKYPHPLFKKICKETHGIFVYQEQVMEATRIIAGYTLGRADILRRAMSKKQTKEMAEERKNFIEGAMKYSKINLEEASYIFDILEKFAGYGFNKSHSVAYAILAYRTAFFKTYYPVEFMAALLSNSEKFEQFIIECKKEDIPILGPSINESGHNFTPVLDKNLKRKAIRFGLSTIKGVGDIASKKIIEERKENGAFLNFYNFLERIDKKSINKKVLESLIKVGSFDDIDHNRNVLLNSIDGLLTVINQIQKDKEKGQYNLFNYSINNFTKIEPLSYKNNIINIEEKLLYEKDLLGFYLSGHPMNKFKYFDQSIISFNENNLCNVKHKSIFRICGVINSIKKYISKKDKRPWASFILETLHNSYKLYIFTTFFNKFEQFLKSGTFLIIQGIVFNKNQDNNFNLSIKDIKKLEDHINDLVIEILFIIIPLKRNKNFLHFINVLKKYSNINKGHIHLKIAIKVNKQKLLLYKLPHYLNINIDQIQQLKNLYSCEKFIIKSYLPNGTKIN